MPAGCHGPNDNSSNATGYNGTCAGGHGHHYTPQQWGDLVRAMDPGYTGHRPRLQLFHGSADPTISYSNMAESESQYINLQTLSTSPTKTNTGLTLGTHQATEQQWNNACGYLVLDGFDSIGGDHGPSDALFVAKYVVPFLGLDQTGAVDPEIAQCGNGGAGGSTGATGGAGGVGGKGTGGAAGSAGGRGGGAGSGPQATGGAGGGSGRGTGGSTGIGGIGGAAGTQGRGGVQGTGGVIATGGDPGGTGGLFGAGGRGGDAATGGAVGTGSGGMLGSGGVGGDATGGGDSGATGCSCALASSAGSAWGGAIVALGLALAALSRARRRSRCRIR